MPADYSIPNTTVVQNKGKLKRMSFVYFTKEKI